MEQVDFAGLFNELVRFETELWNAVDRKLREIESLPLTYFELMQVIARTPGCRVNDISEALSITVGGTSKMVDRIEDAGLCERQIDPEDRRSSRIELTPVGRQRLSSATQTFVAELEKSVGEALSPESLQQFTAHLRQLRSRLRAAGN